MSVYDYRDAVLEALHALYLEQPSLIRAVSPPPPHRTRPRATERCIVARLAMLAHPRVGNHFSSGSMIDIEYERFGGQHRAKTINGAKVSPDLIVHERTKPRANFLAIEVKLAGHRMRRARGLPIHMPEIRGPEVEDYRKIHYLTHWLDHHQYQPTGHPMRPYELGLCVELDSAGAHLWWVRPPDGYSCPVHCEGWVEGDALHAAYERWEPTSPLRSCAAVL